jgi:hypothetical protein
MNWFYDLRPSQLLISHVEPFIVMILLNWIEIEEVNFHHFCTFPVPVREINKENYFLCSNEFNSRLETFQVDDLLS